MNTGIQRSGETPFGAGTTTSPAGTESRPGVRCTPAALRAGRSRGLRGGGVAPRRHRWAPPGDEPSTGGSLVRCWDQCPPALPRGSPLASRCRGRRAHRLDVRQTSMESSPARRARAQPGPSTSTVATRSAAATLFSTPPPRSTSDRVVRRRCLRLLRPRASADHSCAS